MTENTAAGIDPLAIRFAELSEIPALAKLWHDGWQEAHADHVPDALIALRSLDSFAKRFVDMLPTTCTIGAVSDPIGFCAVRENEIYQMYVGPVARGTGAAGRLISDGLDRIRQAGHKQAVLDVIPENHRAIAFYEKMGWKQKAVETASVDTLEGPFPLPCLIMTFDLK